MISLRVICGVKPVGAGPASIAAINLALLGLISPSSQRNRSCENVLWINGQKHGLPPVYFSFSRADSAKSWHIYSQNGQVDLTFTAENCRREKLNLYWLKSNFRQFIGHFNGAISDNHGVVHKINATLGMTEDHFARW